uniref:Exported protein n=1 Tax=Strongyloides papillosus TaxID=174720 RepID=A0A0N5BT13_STREA
MLKLKLLSLLFFILLITSIKSDDNDDPSRTTVKHSTDSKDIVSKSIPEKIFDGALNAFYTLESIGLKSLDFIKYKVLNYNDDINGADDSIDTISEKASKKIIDGAKKAAKIIEKTGKVVIEKTKHTNSREL